MYRILIKSVILLIFTSFNTISLAQESGTFKVTKKGASSDNDSEEYKSRKMLIGVGSAFAGKSSPTFVRDVELTFDYRFRTPHRRSQLLTGIVVGHSNPSEKYKGVTFGVIVTYNIISRPVGAGFVSLPFEMGFKRLYNKFESPDLDQYSIGLGISTYSTRLAPGKLDLTFLVKYHYDSNSIDTFEGVYPTIRIKYRL